MQMRTVWSGSERAKEWRARLNALHASGLVDSSLDALREMPRDEIQRLTEVRRKELVEEGIGTQTWNVIVGVNG